MYGLLFMTLRSGEVSRCHEVLFDTLFTCSSVTEKYLQAVQALSKAKGLDGAHPELHVRVLHFRKTGKWCISPDGLFVTPFRLVSALPQQPPTPIGPALSEALEKLLPGDVTLETFNSQYLQTHSTSPAAVLASAKALHLFQSPIEEIENLLFDQLRPEFSLDVRVCDLLHGHHLL